MVDKLWSWTLDALGNWGAYNATSTAGTLNQTRTHNAVNELINLSTTGGAGAWANPTYDAAGNMTIAPKPGDESTQLHLKYDAWNRLVRVTYDNDVPLAEYRLDGMGRRIVKIVRKMVEGNERWDRTDYFYNEAWQCLEERNQLFEGYGGANCMIAAGVYTEYLWDIRYIDAPVCRWRSVQGGGQGLDECLYYCNDANMNVTALVNASDGAVVERYQYTPYGQVTVYDSAWNVRPNGSAYDNQIQYCGYRLDPETGADSVRYRVFWPPLGRWGQGDPMGYQEDLNTYEYLRGAVLTCLDPMGTNITKFEGCTEDQQAALRKLDARLGPRMGVLKNFFDTAYDTVYVKYRDSGQADYPKGGNKDKVDAAVKSYTTTMAESMKVTKAKVDAGYQVKCCDFDVVEAINEKKEPIAWRMADAVQGGIQVQVYKIFWAKDRKDDDRFGSLFHETLHLSGRANDRKTAPHGWAMGMAGMLRGH